MQKGITHSSSALQQRRTNGRRHTRETTETGACDYCNTGRSWKGRRNEKGGKIVAFLFFFPLLGQPGGVEEGGRTACGNAAITIYFEARISAVLYERVFVVRTPVSSISFQVQHTWYLVHGAMQAPNRLHNQRYGGLFRA